MTTLRRRPLGSHGAACGVWLAVFLGLAILQTWPLATDLGGLSRNDNADAQLNEWIVAWVAHQLPRDPVHLFDANIFYPEPRTLAFSENLILPALMVAPLHWLGASPVAACNVLLILGFGLTGWTTWLLITRWTDDVWAGLLAGCLATFNAHTLTRLPQIQAMQAEFLPLTLLALDRLLTRPAGREAARLALWFTLQALSSLYVMVFTMLSCMAALAVRPLDWLRDRATLRQLTGAGIVSATALALILYPYYRVRLDQGLSRQLSEAAMYAATPATYLSTGGRLHYSLWSQHFYVPGTDSLFPGVTGLLLAIIAVTRRSAWSDARVRTLAGIGVVGFVLSFGPATPIYDWLYRMFPLLQGVRNTSRFGYMALIAVAGLAGFGLASLRRRWRGPHPRLAAVMTVVAIVAVNLEATRVPMGFTPHDGISPIYDSLAAIPDAVVAEFPFPSVQRVAANGPYVLASTRHWKPMLNGYSGFTPASYAEHARALVRFPDPRSIRMLTRTGVTHIVTHGQAIAEAVTSSPWRDRFVEIARVGDDRLYRFVSGAR